MFVIIGTPCLEDGSLRLKIFNKFKINFRHCIVSVVTDCQNALATFRHLLAKLTRLPDFGSLNAVLNSNLTLQFTCTI